MGRAPVRTDAGGIASGVWAFPPPPPPQPAGVACASPPPPASTVTPTHRAARTVRVFGPQSQDPKLAEFLELMRPRSKAKIWSNDELLPDGLADGEPMRGVRGSEGQGGPAQ